MSIRTWIALGVVVALLGTTGLLHVPTVGQNEVSEPVADATTDVDAAATTTSVTPTPIVPLVEDAAPPAPNSSAPPPSFFPSFGTTTISPDAAPPSLRPSIPAPMSPSSPSAGFGGPSIGSGGRGVFVVPR